MSWLVYMLDNHYWVLASGIMFLFMCVLIPFIIITFDETKQDVNVLKSETEENK